MAFRDSGLHEPFRLGAIYCNCCDRSVDEPVVCRHDGLEYCDDCIEVINRELACARCGETAVTHSDSGPLCAKCQAYYDEDYAND